MYKKSKYNYITKDGDRTIFFNGITKRLISFSNEEFVKLGHMMNDLGKFELLFPTFFNKMCDYGFIVPLDFNEFDSLLFKYRQQVFDKSKLRISILPTLDCNLSCWYCVQDHEKGYMSKSIQAGIKNHIIKSIKRDRTKIIHLDWFGGEPMMAFEQMIYPFSLEVQEICKEYDVKFFSNMTTNASLISKKNIRRINEARIYSFQITLDGAKEQHDKVKNQNGEPTFDKIIENINMLGTELDEFHCILRINYDDETLKDDPENIINLIKPEVRNKITFCPIRVWQTQNSEKDERDHNDLVLWRKKFSDAGFYEIKPSNNLSLGESPKCYSDYVNFIAVTPEGHVHKCTGFSNSKLQYDGKIDEEGNIQWKQRNFLQTLYSKASFENSRCEACNLVPLCLGGCIKRQKESIETKSLYRCMQSYSPDGLDDFIRWTYDNMVRNAEFKMQDDICKSHI